MTLKDLQEEMGKSEQNLFFLSIDPDIPEAAKVFDPEDTDNQIKVCFCYSCKRYLFDKKQLPAMSTQNGLKAEKIPKILHELNALDVCWQAQSKPYAPSSSPRSAVKHSAQR